MSYAECAARAAADFRDFCSNPYPGRVIIVGLDQTGDHIIQLYALTGRSENSRNRVLLQDETGRLYTEAADPAKVKDPSLIIYNAMREAGLLHYIVSNGDQTDVIGLLSEGDSLEQALAGRPFEFEPDQSHTQRITAALKLTRGLPSVTMVILRKSPFDDRCDRASHRLNLHQGFGYGIMTYAGDGDPLPPFLGDPLLLPLKGGIFEIAESYWGALNNANRIALAVKQIDVASGRSMIRIINKYSQVK